MTLRINTTSTVYKDCDVYVDFPDDISQSELDKIFDDLEWKTDDNLSSLIEHLKLSGGTHIYGVPDVKQSGENIVVNFVAVK